MATGGHVGGTSNVPKNLIGGWVGGDSNAPKKLLKGWIGDEGNVPKLFFSGEIHGEVVFTESDTWVVPVGVTKIDIFCVGGAGGCCAPSAWEKISGGGYSDFYLKQNLYGIDHENEGTVGADSWNINCGAWGGSGYTTTQLQVTVTPGETLTISVGSYGGDGNGKHVVDGETYDNAQAAGRGGTSSVKRGTTSLCAANGGYGASTPTEATSTSPGSGATTVTKGGNGGSGGRSAGLCSLYLNYSQDEYASPSWSRDVRGLNGSDGGNGSAEDGTGKYNNWYSGSSTNWSVGSSNFASGQGSTTKAFGEAGGVLYDNFGEAGTVIIRW